MFCKTGAFMQIYRKFLIIDVWVKIYIEVLYGIVQRHYPINCVNDNAKVKSIVKFKD